MDIELAFLEPPYEPFRTQSSTPIELGLLEPLLPEPKFYGHRTLAERAPSRASPGPDTLPVQPCPSSEVSVP